MKTATTQGHFILRCLDQRIKTPLILDRKKLIIGTEISCDIKLLDSSVSSYHAFVFVEGSHGFTIKDLRSETGIYVNGKRVEESFVGPNDVLTIGTISFAFEQPLEVDEVPVFNPDEFIPKVELPKAIEVPQKAGLIFIEGEYCDIVFDDSGFEPLSRLPDLSIDGDYVDLDETVDTLDIVHCVKAKKLEVVSYINGLMMDVAYVDLKEGDYYFSPEKKSKRDIQFSTINRTKVFTIKGGELKFYRHDFLIPSVPWEHIKLSNALFLTHGAEQVSLRLVNQASVWRGIPLFYRDREFFKQASKMFVGMFLPLLLLLFVTIPEKVVEQPQVAVVYKLPEPIIEKEPIPEAEVVTEVASTEVTSPTEDTGNKQVEQTPQKVEFQEASQPEKVVAKAATPEPVKVVTPKVAPAPVKTVAQNPKPKPTPAPIAKPTPRPTPVKAYEFKSSVAFNSIVGDAPKINTQGGASGARSGVKDTTFNAGSADSGALVAGANIGVSKFNGADQKGAGSGSYGSRGLASKAGFDSSYLEPKTVVMGSMDPELLRKILREYIPQFRHCYQQELIGHSEKIKGVIDLNFQINANGRVIGHNIKAKDARFSKKGIGCMAKVLSIIDFPKPKGGGVVDVKQPLNFFAESEKI